MRIAVVAEADEQDGIAAALAATVALNLVYLRNHPDTPPLYQSGVRYQRETPTHGGHNEERFLTIPYVLQLGWGDCDDLGAWRAAELRWSGVDPYAQAVPLRAGATTWHVVVRRGDGSIEDPSRALGM